MKKFMVSLLSVLFILVLSSASNAALITQTIGADKVVFDDQVGRYWIWHIGMFSFQTYPGQMSNIAGLDFAGHTDWHMATRPEMDELWGYTEDDFINAFGSSIPAHRASLYWGRYDEFAGVGSHYLGMASTIYPMFGAVYGSKSPLGTSSVPDGDLYPGAWVATDFVVLPATPVPEPATILLLGSGLAGLGALRRRRASQT